jgi:hypothetical protein
MVFHLKKINELSGIGCTIYSPVIDNLAQTLFDKFIDENDQIYPEEIEDIFYTVEAIGKIGAKETFFKLNEGHLGDGVSALYDVPRKLRLFCIRYGTEVVIIGGGAIKEVRKYQEDPKLKLRAEQMILISAAITKILKDCSDEIYWNGNHFSGTLIK